MATQPSSELLGLIQAQNRRRNGDWVRSIGAIPQTAAAFGQDPASAQKVAQSYFPAYGASLKPQPTKMDVAAMKAQIIDKMAKAEHDQRGDELKSLSEMMKDSQDTLKEVIKLAGTAYGAESGALAQIASSANSTSANIGKTLSDAAMEVVQTTNITNKAGVSEAINLLRATMASGGIEDPKSMEMLRDQMSNFYNQGQVAEAAAVMNMAEAMASEYGVEDWRGFIQKHVQSQPGGPAAQILDMSSDPAVASALHENAKNMMFLIEADAADRTSKIIKGVPGMGKVGDFIEKTYAQIGALQDPDERAKAFQLALEGLPSNQDPKSVAAFADLLGQIDTDKPPAGNLLEARQMLFEEPAFKEWMKENGFKDPGMALKELRRITQEKVQSDRASDRELMARRRQTGVDADTGPSPSAQLVNTPAGTPKTEGGDDDTSKFIRGPDGKYWFIEESGAIRPATDEELEQAHYDLLEIEPGQRSAAEKAMFIPTARFAEVKAKADKVAPTGLAQQPKAPMAPPKRSPLALPKPSVEPVQGPVDSSPEDRVAPRPTLGSATRQVTSAVTHPVDTFQTAGTLARDSITALLRKRKTPPGIPETP